MTDIDFTRRIETVTVAVSEVIQDAPYVYIKPMSRSSGNFFKKSDILSVTYAKEKVKRGDVVFNEVLEQPIVYQGSFCGALLFRDDEAEPMVDWTGEIEAGQFVRNDEILTIEDFEE